MFLYTLAQIVLQQQYTHQPEQAEYDDAELIDRAHLPGVEVQPHRQAEHHRRRREDEPGAQRREAKPQRIAGQVERQELPNTSRGVALHSETPLSMSSDLLRFLRRG